VPELDPFGANDPAWERYEGVSQIRRMARAHASRDASPATRRRSFLAAMLVLVSALAAVIGGTFLALRFLID
jgi:ferric-dicitrate binding protein FerR (iron transport regulator)